MEALVENSLRFLSLADANVRFVLFGSLLIGATGGLLGCFAVLRRRSLVGDALAHAALPGVALAFLWTGSRSLPVLRASSVDMANPHSRSVPSQTIFSWPMRILSLRKAGAGKGTGMCRQW